MYAGQFPFYYNYSVTKERAKYIDLPATPLYELGFGLSYTKFEYSNLKMSEEIYSAGDVEVSLDVKNTGSRKGDEVVQLYNNDVIGNSSHNIKLSGDLEVK